LFLKINTYFATKYAKRLQSYTYDGITIIISKPYDKKNLY